MASKIRFSKSDALILILCVVLIANLLVMYLPHIREYARRATCSSRMSDLARGLSGFHEANSRFPSAARWQLDGVPELDYYNPEAPWPGAWPNITAIHPGRDYDTSYENWAAEVLPYVVDGDGFETGDFDKLVSDEANVQFRLQRVEVMVCPTDDFNNPQNHFIRSLTKGGTTEHSRGNFAINGGTQRDCQIPGQPADPCPNGFFFEYDPHTGDFAWWGNGVAGINKSFACDQIARGLSKTVLLEEVRAGIDPIDPRGVWSLGQIGASITWGHGINGDAGAPNCQHDRSDDVAGCGKLTDKIGRQRLHDERMGCCWYCQGNVQATARSMHPGGVQIAMVDGAVRFITNNVSADLWHIMHSREASSTRKD
ncbi:MAG: DUF1559 domain-containing protein [Planctomycetales bacterium]|nr:DUF1559 domain-containing protein [Planctomycetales bacterium]